MRGPRAYLNGIRHPEAFHGLGRSSDFFEGWYVKIVTADLAHRYAVIPGVFRGPRSARGANDHAFVQVLNGMTGEAAYHRFPVDAFHASGTAFDVTVGSNRFSTEGFTLDLPELQGTVSVTTAFDPWPVTLRSPGIMGWYGLVPFMECFHGVVSFGHALTGTLRVTPAPADSPRTPKSGAKRPQHVSFDGGRGYIEKDWGSAFPAGYVWLNSNHLTDDPSACLIGSVAIIPWLRRPFRGFIVGLRRDDGLSTWTTYNGATERALTITDDHIEWVLDGPHGRIELFAERQRGGLLHAPLRTDMIARVDETLDATVSIRHTGERGHVLLDTQGVAAGMEVYGDTDRLLGLSTGS